MLTYNIADILISTDAPFPESVWDNFISASDLTPDAEVSFIKRDLREYGMESFHINSDYKFISRCDRDMMLVNGDWSRAGVLIPCETPALSTFYLQIFYTHALRRGMIQVHSSLIEINGEGILFIGKSGIGKTTQAELWAKHENAVIINGDMNFVERTDGGFIAHGTPWHGSSPYCENRSIKIRAIAALEQSRENEIICLSDFQKLGALSDSIIYPRWIPDGMERCLEVMGDLLKAVPVYRLKNRADRDCVEITRRAVFRETT